MTRRPWLRRKPITRRGAWYNLGDNRARTATDLDAIHAYNPAWIGLCECLDRKDLIVKWAKWNGYRICASDKTPGGWETVILYRRGVTRAWVHPAAPAYRKRDAGAGGKQGIPAKATPHIRYGRGIRRLHVAGAHLIPSTHIAARRPWFDWHIDALLHVLAKRVGGIVIGGDFNAMPANRLLDPMRAAGYTQHLHRDTHSRWQPDHLWARRVRSVDPVTLLALSSDHLAVIYDVTY